MKTMIAAATTALLMTGTAMAHDYTAGDLRIDHPVAREAPANAPVSAGYMTIRNTGTQADRLIGGTVDFADTVEIHEMTMDGDVMRMREIEGGIEIPPGGEVTLKPGGLHMMFMDMQRPIKADEGHAGTLHFEHAGTVNVVFNVETLSQIREAMSAAGHAHGTMQMDKTE